MRLNGIALGETAEGLGSLGLRMAGDATVVGGVTLRAIGDHGDRGIVALDLDGANADGPLPIAPVQPPVPASEPLHGIGATAVDHVVVLTGDVEGTIAGLGAQPRHVDERDGRRYGFVVAGTCVLEFVGPVEPDARPAQLWGIALAVADLDAAAGLLGDACGEPKDAVQQGRRIATVRHEALGLETAFVLMSERPVGDASAD